MKPMSLKIFLSFLAVFMFSPAHAVDINLINIEAPQSSPLPQSFGNAYGYTPQQVAPAMMGPVTEVPTILQIAKNAATLPIGIWALRKMGFGYMDILKMYALPPSILFNPEVPYDRFGPSLGQAGLYQQQYGNTWPRRVSLADSVLIQLGQIKFFTDYLKIPIGSILSLPTDPLTFSQLVLRPYSNPTYFIPPGQAMKMGLWTPPGLAKKGYVGHPGHGTWKSEGKEKGGKSEWKFEAKGNGNGKGKGKFF